jgi:alpha-L-fucosidase
LSGSYASINSAFHDVINQNRDNQMAMANMAATQTELLKQLADMREKYEAILATHNHQATPIRRNGNRTRTNRGNKDPNGYCWTHGYNVRQGHNSATCRNKAPGHQVTATREDNMGGAQTGKTQA